LNRRSRPETRRNDRVQLHTVGRNVLEFALEALETGDSMRRKVAAELLVAPNDRPTPKWRRYMNDKTLQTRRQAKVRTPTPLDLPMVAAILRRASESNHVRGAEIISEQVNNQMENERGVSQEIQAKLVKKAETAESTARRYQSLIHQIENALGECILNPNYIDGGFAVAEDLPKEISEKLAVFRQTDLADARRMLEVAADQLRSAALRARWALRQAGVRVVGRSMVRRR
jgi:hypothetical protein